MSEIPPKHSPDAPAYDAAETGSGLVAMYNAASHANAESFPVLKAFQDYIEAERTQARKRVMQLSIFFAVLMCVVVTGFLTAGIFMLRNMTDVQSKLLDVALANKESSAPQPAAPAPSFQAQPLLEESVRQMSRVTSEFQSSLDKKLDGVNAIASKVHEKVASQDTELVKLRDDFRQMQERSAKLNDELAALKEDRKKAAALAAVKPLAAPTPTPRTQAPRPAVTAPPANVPAQAVPAVPAAVAKAVVPVARSERPTVAAAPAAAPEKPAADPRYPPQVKEPPAAPAGVTPPPAPQGLVATAIPLKTKNAGTIPWRVLIPN